MLDFGLRNNSESDDAGSKCTRSTRGSRKKKTEKKIVFLFTALQILRRICVLGRVWHENLLGGGGAATSHGFAVVRTVVIS